VPKTLKTLAKEFGIDMRELSDLADQLSLTIEGPTVQLHEGVEGILRVAWKEEAAKRPPAPPAEPAPESAAKKTPGDDPLADDLSGDLAGDEDDDLDDEDDDGFDPDAEVPPAT